MKFPYLEDFDELEFLILQYLKFLFLEYFDRFEFRDFIFLQTFKLLDL
jgi:hypothetical protein